MCLWVSGWGLRVSGNVHINTKSVGKEIILGHGTQMLSFIPVTCIALKRLCLGVSGLCLRGVWMVSVGVWIVSGGVWQMSGTV